MSFVNCCVILMVFCVVIRQSFCFISFLWSSNSAPHRSRWCLRSFRLTSPLAKGFSWSGGSSNEGKIQMQTAAMECSPSFALLSAANGARRGEGNGEMVGWSHVAFEQVARFSGMESCDSQRQPLSASYSAQRGSPSYHRLLARLELHHFALESCHMPDVAHRSSCATGPCNYDRQ